MIKNKQKYLDHAYYFLTGKTYGSLDKIKSSNYPTNEIDYFTFLYTDQLWTFTYAMNWISQLNFFHHFTNCRVMYITGSTGVGKSTQVPKLLMYSLKMINYNPSGKIICTQPRIHPTTANAETISREMGVPIKAYDKNYKRDVFTNNYHVQYKYADGSHVDKNTDSYLRIVTDGSLVSDIKKYPFLTQEKKSNIFVDNDNNTMSWQRSYTANNIYDIVIVDEAHEHNTNMDVILTLIRDSVYVN